MACTLVEICAGLLILVKILIIKGSPKWVLYLLWWVQAFGLLYFDSIFVLCT